MVFEIMSVIASDLFAEITLIFIFATLISIFIKFLKQPILIGYIITGILIGPLFFNILLSEEIIFTFSKIGIALLLFIVGLNLKLSVFKDGLGKISLYIALSQILLTAFFSLLITMFFTTNLIHSLLLSISLAFSSTVVVTKLLFEKNEIESLYGRVAIGILIIQDFFAVLMLMLLPSFTNINNLYNTLTTSFINGVVMLIIIFTLTYFTFPRYGKFITTNPDIMLIFSVSWCLSLSTIFEKLGFSLEIGAIIAGITMSLMPYNFEISAKIRPLQDFFIILFFILIGTQIDFGTIFEYFSLLVILILFTVIGKPIITIFLMGSYGFTKRNSFLTGVSLSQASEFSIIMLSLAYSINFVDKSVLSIITLVTVVSIAISTYTIIYSHKIYTWISKYLVFFEKRGRKIDEQVYHKKKKYDIILFGCDRIGYSIMEYLKRARKNYLVIDYNPQIITKIVKEGVECRYGDVNDIELLNKLDLKDVKMVISTISSFDTNSMLISRIRNVNKDAILIVVSHQIEEALKLYDIGATYVLMPHFLGGKHATTMIEEYGFDVSKFIEEKVRHMEHIKKRKEMGHEYPRQEK